MADANPPMHRSDVHRDATPSKRPNTPVSMRKKSTLKRNAKRVKRAY